MEAKLKEDIRSSFYKKGSGKEREPYRYGRAGEKIRVISSHGDVWIVEGKSGIRFPVHLLKLEL